VSALQVGLLTTALAVIGTICTTWITQRFLSKRAKSDDTQKLIDQLQEERDAADRRRQEADQKHSSELAGVRRDLAEVRGRVDGLEDRELTWSDYAAALRDHIDQRLGPPPPPWPADLMRRRRR